MDLFANSANHCQWRGFRPDDEIHRIPHEERKRNVHRGRNRLAQSAIGSIADHAHDLQPVVAAFGRKYPRRKSRKVRQPDSLTDCVTARPKIPRHFLVDDCDVSGTPGLSLGPKASFEEGNTQSSEVLSTGLLNVHHLTLLTGSSHDFQTLPDVLQGRYGKERNRRGLDAWQRSDLFVYPAVE